MKKKSKKKASGKCLVPVTKKYKVNGKNSTFKRKSTKPISKSAAEKKADIIRNRGGRIARVVKVCGGWVPYEGRKRRKLTLKRTGQRISGKK